MVALSGNLDPVKNLGFAFNAIYEHWGLKTSGVTLVFEGITVVYSVRVRA